LIPVLIGNPSEGAFREAGGLFRDRRYLDLRSPDPAGLAQLVQEVRRQQEPRGEQFDRIINTLVDGNEEQRANVLQQIHASESLDRYILSARLRREVEERFDPTSETRFAASVRDSKRISSIRSWMLRADPQSC
jgi:hypothetical protein